MKKIFLLIALAVSVGSFAQTKTGYSVDFKVNGLKDTTAYLGYFIAEQAYIRDTAKVNSKGQFAFTGKTPLPQGVYFLVLNKMRLLDVMIGPNQHFLIETDTSAFKRPDASNVHVKNDIDNKLYFDNLSHIADLNKRAEPYVKILQDTTLKDEAKKKEAQKFLQNLNVEAQAYQEKVISENPTTMSSRLFKSTKQINVPEPPKRADGSIDSLWQLKYYREHYFDYFNLADDALTRISQPLYKNKVNEYLDKLYVQQPDTIMKAITKLVSMAKKNPETYKYLIIQLTSKYGTPEYMGLDEVFVWMYYTYYATGEMDFWATEKHKKNLKDFADKLCKSLIGKTGPNLMMQDANFQPRSLYDIKAKYKILYIYDPSCPSCKKETPVLVNFYNKNKVKLGVEVFAVNSDSSMAEMRQYIKDMGMKWITVNGPRTYFKVSYHDQYDAESTPSLFILDSNNKIIAKKLPAAKIEDFILNYEKIMKRKAATKQPDRVPFDCNKAQQIKSPVKPKS